MINKKLIIIENIPFFLKSLFVVICVKFKELKLGYFFLEDLKGVESLQQTRIF